MQIKKWVDAYFGECIECGGDVEILTDSDDPALFYDGDEVRCKRCAYLGQFSCDTESPGYIIWGDEF